MRKKLSNIRRILETPCQQNMETFVLIPEQLSLQLTPDTGLRVVSNQIVPRGFRFSPFQGTLRTDDKLSPAILDRGRSDRYYYWGGFRAASWVRFLRQCHNLTPDANLVELVLPGGQVVYEVRRSLEPWEELVVFSPEPPVSLAKALKEAIFEQTMRALMLEVPLDLSTSLFHKVVSSIFHLIITITINYHHLLLLSITYWHRRRRNCPCIFKH